MNAGRPTRVPIASCAAFLSSCVENSPALTFKDNYVYTRFHFIRTSCCSASHFLNREKRDEPGRRNRTWRRCRRTGTLRHFTFGSTLCPCARAKPVTEASETVMAIAHSNRHLLFGCYRSLDSCTREQLNEQPSTRPRDRGPVFVANQIFRV